METAPFLHGKIVDLIGGDSEDTNIPLIYTSGDLAADIAKAFDEKQAK